MRRESGFTLIELLVAATLMIVVMGATLTAVEQFQKRSVTNQAVNDSQETARVSVEKISRDLRNAGTPASGSTNGIVRATSEDMVFQSVDPTGASVNLRRTQWVRYCLDKSVPANERIWRQTLAINGTPVSGGPFATTCPDPGVGTSSIVTDKIVNDQATPNTALFTYYPALSASPSQNERDAISRVTLSVLVNSDLVRQIKPTRLTTGIYLRDQAAPPTAAFETPLVSGQGWVYLNGSPSADPANQPLAYRWCDTTTDSTCSASGTNVIGTGQTLSYHSPSGTRSITLTVTNGSGLSNSTSQTVVVQ